MRAQKFTVDPEASGKRLDQYLAGMLPEVSRARVQELISAGAVRLGGQAAKASTRLRGGEKVEIAGAVERPAMKAEAEDIDVPVVYDDPEFAVANKPAGMTVHAGAGSLEQNRGTLVNAMLHRFRELSGGADALRPGIVHRLDRETSGLLLVAKTDFAHQQLAAQFQRREVEKRYVALVHGAMHPARGTVEFPIARDPVHRKRMRALRDSKIGEGRRAVTHYEVTEEVEGEYGRFSLLRVRIETGRTHQIRVHLSALRHPIVGDKLYGGKQILLGERGAAEVVLERNFLHAEELKFKHPRTGEWVECVAPLPQELTELLRRVRKSGV